MIKSATFGPDRIHRYSLTRQWLFGNKTIMWLMLNPSTADEWQDDPTIRRCIGYSQQWGYDGLIICNIFAFRATLPEDMRAAADPIGQDNDATILQLARECDRVMVGWGNHGEFLQRSSYVIDMLRSEGIDLFCLGTNSSGEPKHPLYLAKSLEPIPYLKPIKTSQL